MIDRALPPIAPDVTIRPCEIQEAFALCYLAAYNDQAIQPRVFQSFNRAYGPDFLFQTPFVDGGRPGYCIAQWNSPLMKRVTVAIEGARSFAQFRTVWGGVVGQSSLTGHLGACWTTAKTYADQIHTLLMADSNFTSMLALTPCPITFTGYSLGAAIAEILAERFSISHPLKGRSCIKFASPRVGNPQWISGRSRTTRRASVYCGRDPIDLFPQFSPSLTGLETLGNLGSPVYATDPAASRFAVLGEEETAFYEGGSGQVIRYGRAARQTIDATNPWFDHQRGIYRMMFCNLTNPWSSLDKWRFRYLEFNDENSWGVAYRPDRVPSVAMEYLNPTQPNPVEVDIAPQIIQVAREALDPDIGGTSVGGEWGWSGGSDDDLVAQIPDPVLPTMREILAPLPATFTPTASGRRRR